MPEKKSTLKIDSTKPWGKIIINICKNNSCFQKNSGIIKSVEDELGIKPGETTSDGKFSFELTDCIDACSKAPALKINDVIHADLTSRKVSQILKTYK